MLNIAICDDDMHICSQVEEIILDYNKLNEVDFDVEVFSSGEELINFIANEHPFDVIFLDIELGKINGVQVGNTIRNEFDDHISKIVFISSKDGYENELFNVQPLNFLRKPIMKQKVLECVKLAIKIFEKENNLFEYKVGHELKKIRIREILYFESSIKKIKIVTFRNEDYFYGSLQEIKNKLSKSFIFPHRSFLVNYYNIEQMTDDTIYMSNGDRLPISRRNLKNIIDLQIAIEKE